MSRPHRYPKNAPAEVLAWECAACGEWIREYGRYELTACSVDWRKPTRRSLTDRLLEPVARLITWPLFRNVRTKP